MSTVSRLKNSMAILIIKFYACTIVKCFAMFKDSKQLEIARFDKSSLVNELIIVALPSFNVKSDNMQYLLNVLYSRRRVLAIAHAVSGAVLRTNAAQDTQPWFLFRPEQGRLRLRRGLDSARGQIIAGHAVETSRGEFRLRQCRPRQRDE